MQALVVEFMIHPPHVADFEREILANARASLATEPGCRQFDVCRDPGDRCRFFLYELYDNEAAVQAHLAAPHFLEMSRVSTDWVDKKTVWRYTRISP
jgi:quinol monooxygenase YgiN